MPAVSLDRRRRIAGRLTGWERASLQASIAFVLVGGAIYSLILGSKVRFADEGDYLALSQRLADTGTYSRDGINPSAFRPPGYAHFLAFLRLFGTPEVGLRFANFVCLALMVWAAWWLARKVGGAMAATLTAPLVALYPLGFYTTGAFYPQALGGALLLGGMVAVVSVPGSRHPLRLALAAGLAFGALLVTIPPLAIVVVVSVVWLGFVGPPGPPGAPRPGRHLRHPALLDGAQRRGDGRSRARVDEQRHQPAARQQPRRLSPQGSRHRHLELRR